MKIALHTGDSTTVLLQKEGVGGYNWFVTCADKEGVSITTKILPAASKLVGAGAVLQVRFAALKAGTYTVTAEWRRSWEKQAAKVQQYEIVVS
ncbi:protease inhibitor I42 family protein [Phnomibacter sp. MR]|uniref:protease inhibitor I42 family protein n=1 Tax=Phnomibacter sp. MR TaxID=3042318 RepID=UPI003A805DB8